MPTFPGCRAHRAGQGGRVRRAVPETRAVLVDLVDLVDLAALAAQGVLGGLKNLVR
jgi:hypothetical protein